MCGLPRQQRDRYALRRAAAVRGAYKHALLDVYSCL